MKEAAHIVNLAVIPNVDKMITGFEEAMDSFIDRECEIAAYEELIYPLEEEAAEIYARYRKALNNFRESLPPEAFQGYGGQTPQVDYNLPEMSERDKARLEEIKTTIEKLREKYNLR